MLHNNLKSSIKWNKSYHLIHNRKHNISFLKSYTNHQQKIDMKYLDSVTYSNKISSGIIITLINTFNSSKNELYNQNQLDNNIFLLF
jgi:hypothetical protein